MAYCTVQQVSDRLLAVGVLYAVDDDADDTLDAGESDLVQDAIDDAATEIDEALAPWLDDPRTADGNEWIRVRAIDLACERVCERKGQVAPEGIKAAAQRSREKLDLVRRGTTAQNGLRVPGISYPGDTDTSRLKQIGLPQIGNPSR